MDDNYNKWDIYFMKFAQLASTNTKCLSRPVGAALVKNGHVISTGYNGPPAGVVHCEYRDDDGSYPKPYWYANQLNYSTKYYNPICPRQRMGFKSGEGMEHCPAVHGEANAVIQAAKLGIPTKGTTLYCWCGQICHNCAKEIINAGVIKVVSLGLEKYGNGIQSLDLFTQAGVEIVLLPKEKVI